MKPEISTAVMIERVREMAADSSDSQERVLLSSVAGRIELLLAAESGMSREMACIRHALDIPPDQSVQSGVVDAFVQLNAKIQDLSGQVVELGKQDPVYQYQSEIYDEDSGETEWYWDDCDIGFYSQYAEDRRRILFTRPVPPAAGQPSYRDGIEAAAKWLDKRRESFDSEHGRHDPDTGTFEFGNDAQLEHSSTLAELSEGIRALQPAASQPYTVPDGWVLVPAKANAAMVSAAGRAAREYMEEYGGNSPQVIYQAMLAVAPKLDRKDGDA